MRLSVSMIVKNESAHIADCLDSIKDADEIVIVDTGSEDDTVNIAKRYTDKVFTDYKWKDSFAEARNCALAKCTGDGILSIDADEVLEPGGIQKIKKAIMGLPQGTDIKKLYLLLKDKKHGQTHRFPRVFERCPEMYWIGAVHNYLSKGNGMPVDITITYGYSEAHKKDPNRTLRILAKEVNKKPDCQRDRYYLAREFWYRKEYETAVYHYDIYLKYAKWMPEKADAYLMRAKCLWLMRKGEEARTSCLEAIKISANFKEALYLMAEMTYSPNKERWVSFAKLATNEDVLFVRVQ